MAQEFVAFLKDSYYIPLYLLTWIIAVITYKKYYDTILKYLPVFIAYTFFTELLGYFIKNYDSFQFFSDERYAWQNVIIYNIYSVASFAFFYYIYWVVLKTSELRNLIKYGALLSMGGYIISLFFQNPFHSSLYYADLVASIVLLFCIYIYFKEKKKEVNAYPMRQNLLFWISLGLAVFHIFFPFIFIALYEVPSFYYGYHLYEILVTLIMIMYILFIIGFVVSKRKAFR